MPYLPAREINTEVPNTAPLPRVFSQLHGGRLITLDRFYYGRDNILFLLEYIDIYSGYRFAFPTYDVLDKISIHGLSECFIHSRGIIHSIASDQETYFPAKEVWQWALAYGIHGSYHAPYQPEAAVLIK